MQNVDIGGAAMTTAHNVEVSVAFAPELETPDHIVLAEHLGFARAWCYDAPAIWADLWMTLARAADRTTRIGLASGVLVPSYRHVMATAAAIATLAGQAPGRVVVGVGVGHGNKMMGGRAVPWVKTADYIAALRTLLKGEPVQIDSGLAQMLHDDGFCAPRPLDVPILIAAQGLKGLEVARELADGVISVAVPNAGFEWSSVVVTGTVLPDGGDIDNDVLMDAAGAGAAVAYHIAYDLNWKNGPALATIPNADKWAKELEKTAPGRRHLVAWARHLVGVTDVDRAALTPELVRSMTFTGTPGELRTRLQALADLGATEVIYQPAGPDIPGELRRFAAMAGL